VFLLKAVFKRDIRSFNKPTLFSLFHVNPPTPASRFLHTVRKKTTPDASLSTFAIASFCSWLLLFLRGRGSSVFNRAIPFDVTALHQSLCKGRRAYIDFFHSFSAAGTHVLWNEKPSITDFPPISRLPTFGTTIKQRRHGHSG